MDGHEPWAAKRTGGTPPWCRTDDAHAADTTLRIDSLFREELKAAGLRRLRFRLDIVGIDSATVLRPTLRYYADYAPLVEAGRTYAIPTGDGQGIEARLLNLRAETLGTQLYYLLGTLAGFGLLGLGIFTQVGIIRRQDKLAQMREDFSYAMIRHEVAPHHPAHRPAHAPQRTLGRQAGEEGTAL